MLTAAMLSAAMFTAEMFTAAERLGRITPCTCVARTFPLQMPAAAKRPSAAAVRACILATNSSTDS